MGCIRWNPALIPNCDFQMDSTYRRLRKRVTVKLTVTNKDGCSSKRTEGNSFTTASTNNSKKDYILCTGSNRQQVLYTYNVTNSGNASLNYLSIVDD